MVGQFDGKVALVTGAGSGIGMATSLAFARDGARVLVADVSSEGGERTVRMINEIGGQAIFVRTDVSRPADVQAMVSRAVEAYGRLDFAFNNAGIEGQMVPAVECTEENWDRVIGTNLKGVWLCMKYEIPEMLKQGKGAIVNMSSVAGLVGTRNAAAYCASKGGVVQLTRASALDYAKSGIRINAVCPGAIRTPMVDRVISAQPEMEATIDAAHPIGRMGEPDEIASAVVWLCSDAASFILGHAMPIDGGWVTQ